MADARRRAGEDQVTRLEGAEARRVRDEAAHAEDQLGGVPVLEQFAVQALHDAEAAAVAELRHRNERFAERAEGVEPLAARPLLVAVLQVARRDVVRAAVAGDEVERVVLGDPAPGAADLDSELRLGVDVRRLRRDNDRLAAADQRVGELPEEERLRRRLPSRLPDVAQVVEAGAEDLHDAILALGSSAWRSPSASPSYPIRRTRGSSS